jgi:hypothetical protein
MMVDVDDLTDQCEMIQMMAILTDLDSDTTAKSDDQTSYNMSPGRRTREGYFWVLQYSRPILIPTSSTIIQ